MAKQPGALGAAAGSDVAAPERWGIDAARKELYALVEAAASGARVLIGRDEKAAALVGLTEVSQERLTASPTVPVTQARRKLGDLLAAAASDRPQILLHHGRPTAVLVPATHEVAAGETGQSHPLQAGGGRRAGARRLTDLAAGLDAVLASVGQTGPAVDTVARGPSFGLAALERAAPLIPGKVTAVAAAPHAGGSLLVVAAARHTALHQRRPVLYAASGLTATDVAARVIAAEAGVDYRRLRAHALTPAEQDAAAAAHAQLTQAAGSLWHIDDGVGLAATDIGDVAADVPDLALVVVDRLQAVGDPAVPLSGAALPAATQALAHTARRLRVPVVVAVDTDDPATLGALGADLTLTVTPDGPAARVDITERDFGHLTTVHLTPDLHHARFTDPANRAPAGAPSVPPDRQGRPPRPAGTSVPPDTSTGPPQPPGPENLTEDHAAGERQAEPQPEASSPPTPGLPPRSAQGAAAPRDAVAAPRPAGGTPGGRRPSRTGTGVKAGLERFVADRVERALAECGGDTEAALRALAGEGGSAIPDVMELFEATRVESNYQHTAYPRLPGPLVRQRRDSANEVWEARPKFTHPDVPPGTVVTELDVNAAYLAALQSAHLPVRTVTHNPDGFDDLDNYGRGVDLAGICRIDPVNWSHPDLPHPLGDDREVTGSLWVPTSVVLSLKDFSSASYGELCAPPVVREAYVAKGSASLFKSLVKVLNTARLTAVENGDTMTKSYVAAMYAKLVSTMGDSRNNHQLKRPEWQHIIRSQAFANLRRKAVRARQAGLTVAHAGGTDELHLAGDVWGATTPSGRPLFTRGAALSQIKPKGTRTAGGEA